MFTFKTICHPTSDTEQPLVILNTESSSHYFGKCPEGTQRNLIEKNIRPSRVKNFFLTGLLDWSALGGLPGFTISMASAGITNLTLLFGSSILNYVIATWRPFVFRHGIHLHTHTPAGDETVEEKHFFVRVVHTDPASHTELLLPSVNRTLKAMVLQMFPREVLANDPQIGTYDPSATSPVTHTELPPVALPSSATSYVIQFKQARGKFSIAKARALNIPPGPLYAQLTAGKSVTVDGRVVLPTEVVSASRKMGRVVIVDVPTAAHLAATMASTAWFDSVDTDSDSAVAMVYHFLGREVTLDETYLRFINRFGSACVHIVSHPLYCPNTINFHSAAVSTLKLRAVHPECFSLPIHTTQSLRLLRDVHPALVPLLAHQEVLVTPEGIMVEPLSGEAFTWSALYEEHIEKRGFLCDKQAVIGTAKDEQPLHEVEVVTLGTGSAIPSRYRNVLSSLVRIPQTGGQVYSVLLDGGEGTFGAMARLYGPQLSARLREVRMIYLSHLHADHHLGIITVIREWFAANHPSSRLFIVCPWSYNRFVREWCLLEPTIAFDRIDYLNCQDFLTLEPSDEEYAPVPFDTLVDPSVRYQLPTVPRPPNHALIRDLYRELGLREIATCKALHCKWAYSVALHFENPDFKVAYSGDTRPNPVFTQIAQGCHLMLHEATFEDERIEDAIAKRHSTISEALFTARLLRARKVVLTHFSLRYGQVPPMHLDQTALERMRSQLAAHPTENIFAHPGDATRDLEVVYAFDGMRIPYDSMHTQRPLADQLTAMFGSNDSQC